MGSEGEHVEAQRRDQLLTKKDGWEEMSHQKLGEDDWEGHLYITVPGHWR